METNIAGVAPLQDVPTSITNAGKMGFFARVQNWYAYQLTPKKILFICVVGILCTILIASSIYAYIIYTGSHKTIAIHTTPTPTQTPTPTPTPLMRTDPLTGQTLVGDATKVLDRPPLAVMIENSIPARPQTGLNQADVVYEALAEGGITRFMAIFLQNTTSIIGPVRSARTYYLSFERQFNAIYAHWGQNSDVAPSIASDNIRNVDAIFQPGTENSCTHPTGLFCRDDSRLAPHNGYGFPQKIWDFAASQGWTGASNLEGWVFKADAASTGTGVDQAKLNISFMQNDSDYAATWVYDKSSNLFTRYDGTVLQKDRADGTPITAKNIVLQFVNGNVYTSSGGKDVYGLQTTGSGKASFFIDGKETDGTWKRDSEASLTVFYDATGNPIQFDEGRTWISVLVNNTGSFTYK